MDFSWMHHVSPEYLWIKPICDHFLCDVCISPQTSGQNINHQMQQFLLLQRHRHWNKLWGGGGATWTTPISKSACFNGKKGWFHTHTSREQTCLTTGSRRHMPGTLYFLSGPPCFWHTRQNKCKQSVQSQTIFKWETFYWRSPVGSKATSAQSLKSAYMETIMASPTGRQII